MGHYGKQGAVAAIRGKGSSSWSMAACRGSAFRVEPVHRPRGCCEVCHETESRPGGRTFFGLSAFFPTLSAPALLNLVACKPCPRRHIVPIPRVAKARQIADGGSPSGEWERVTLCPKWFTLPSRKEGS